VLGCTCGADGMEMMTTRDDSKESEFEQY
jgi:hypothetical protein